MMGAKYMPSVIYRVRMLTFSSDNIDDVIPAISGIGINEDERLDAPNPQAFRPGAIVKDALDGDNN